MHKIKVSVIIPVYNTEKYIIECLKSVDLHSGDDVEVIIVDDGSTDTSVALIESYIQNRKKFILIRQENGGVSSARNRGISEARGEWITFIDSDDYVEANFFASMVNAVNTTDTDFCMAGFKKYDETTNVMHESVLPVYSYGIRENMLNNIFYPCPVARLYKTEIVKKNNISFNRKIRVGEDRAFNFEYLRYVKNCVTVADDSYVYRMRAGSATHRIVWPNEKNGIWQYAKAFWYSFKDERVIKEAVVKSHHLAHNLLDSYLAEIINAVLSVNKCYYVALIKDDVGGYICKNYRFQGASTKEKILVGLLARGYFKTTKLVIKLYYSPVLFRLLKNGKNKKA